MNDGRAETGPENPLDGLPAELGYVEPDWLRLIREQVIADSSTKSAEEVDKIYNGYMDFGQREVDRLEGDDHAKAQIGLCIMSALIWRDRQRVDYYVTALEQAETMAFNRHLDQTVGQLARAIVAATQ